MEHWTQFSISTLSLAIVVVLIILNHFPVRIFNTIAHSSVHVLVTVVQISFSKLLLAIIDVFVSA